MPIPIKDQLDYAMKHFVFIADQRMRTFNFYIIVFSATIAATVASFEKLPKIAPFLACGIIHIIVATVFTMMDWRSRRLVKMTLRKIREMELSEEWPPAARLAIDDHEEMNKPKNKIISYTSAFNIVFAVQFLVGIGMLLCATRYIAHS